MQNHGLYGYHYGFRAIILHILRVYVLLFKKKTSRGQCLGCRVWGLRLGAEAVPGTQQKGTRDTGGGSQNTT